jgi:glycosyltransferase involved in cell wall biosynthesis
VTVDNNNGSTRRNRASVPVVALVHDNFTGPTGMGRVLNSHARFILDVGWELCIVGDNVPTELRAGSRQVITVRNPRGLPKLPEHFGWCRRARVALRSVAANIVHVHSPWLADTADLQTSHFVSQAAFTRDIREPAKGLEGHLRRLQASATRRADDRLYRRRRPSTYLSFVSELLRDEFWRHYGEPRGGWIFGPPAPRWRPPDPAERSRARAALGVPERSIAVGYLGGTDPRKGFEHVLALQADPSLELLFAGPGSERVAVGGRPGLGFVDVGPFLSACDVVAAPSRFDSAPVAVLEALARGVPVVTTDASGWADAIKRHGCGVVWSDHGAPLADACRRAAVAPGDSCRALIDEFAPRRQREVLIGAYEQILGSATR